MKGLGGGRGCSDGLPAYEENGDVEGVDGGMEEGGGTLHNLSLTHTLIVTPMLLVGSDTVGILRSSTTQSLTLHCCISHLTVNDPLMPNAEINFNDFITALYSLVTQWGI